jgi:hypothetical protein
MRYVVILGFYLVPHLVLAADYPIQKTEWALQFKFHFKRDFCAAGAKNSACFPVSQAECEELIGPYTERCIKTLGIHFPVANQEVSALTGDKVGRCIGRNIQDKIKPKDRKKCRVD